MLFLAFLLIFALSVAGFSSNALLGILTLALGVEIVWIGWLFTGRR